MDEEALRNLFNVGDILVEVSYDGDVPEARSADPWLAAMGQGGEIVVRLDEYDPPKGSVPMRK
jgi:hypothetical protein